MKCEDLENENNENPVCLWFKKWFIYRYDFMKNWFDRFDHRIILFYIGYVLKNIFIQLRFRYEPMCFNISIYSSPLYSNLCCVHACAPSHLVRCVGLIVYGLFVGNIPISRLYLVHYFSHLTHRVGFADIFVLLDQFLGLGCAAWVSELWDALLPLSIQTGELV